MLTPDSVKEFMAKYDIGVAELARRAGVKRYSVHRWLTEPSADITLRTHDKLDLAMRRMVDEVEGKRKGERHETEQAAV